MTSEIIHKKSYSVDLAKRGVLTMLETELKRSGQPVALSTFTHELSRKRWHPSMTDDHLERKETAVSRQGELTTNLYQVDGTVLRQAITELAAGDFIAPTLDEPGLNHVTNPNSLLYDITDKGVALLRNLERCPLDELRTRGEPPPRSRTFQQRGNMSH